VCYTATLYISYVYLKVTSISQYMSVWKLITQYKLEDNWNITKT